MLRRFPGESYKGTIKTPRFSKWTIAEGGGKDDKGLTKVSGQAPGNFVYFLLASPGPAARQATVNKPFCYSILE